MAEGYKQTNDKSIYVAVKNFSEKLVVGLTEKSNKIFERLCSKNVIKDKEAKFGLKNSFFELIHVSNNKFLVLQ